MFKKKFLAGLIAVFSIVLVLGVLSAEETQGKALKVYTITKKTYKKPGKIFEPVVNVTPRLPEITRCGLLEKLDQYGFLGRYTEEPLRQVFPDVPLGHACYDLAFRAFRQEAMVGNPDGNFRPNATMNKAEVSTVASGAADLDPVIENIGLPYDDVDFNDWYYSPIAALRLEGLFINEAAASFEPAKTATVLWVNDLLNELSAKMKPVSRCEFLSYLNNYGLLGRFTGEGDTFTDLPWDHWCHDFAEQAAFRDLMIGYPDGTFMPDASLSKAEAGKVIADAAVLPFGGNVPLMQDIRNEWFFDHVVRLFNADALEKEWATHFFRPMKLAGMYWVNYVISAVAN